MSTRSSIFENQTPEQRDQDSFPLTSAAKQKIAGLFGRKHQETCTTPKLISTTTSRVIPTLKQLQQPKRPQQLSTVLDNTGKTSTFVNNPMPFSFVTNLLTQPSPLHCCICDRKCYVEGHQANERLLDEADYEDLPKSIEIQDSFQKTFTTTKEMVDRTVLVREYHFVVKTISILPKNPIFYSMTSRGKQLVRAKAQKKKEREEKEKKRREKGGK